MGEPPSLCLADGISCVQAGAKQKFAFEMSSSESDYDEEGEAARKHESRAMRGGGDAARTKASKSWMLFRARSAVVPVEEDVATKLDVSASTPRVLLLHSVTGFQLPKALKSRAKRGGKLRFAIHLSLFNTHERHFFGNTWVSETVAQKKGGSVSLQHLVYYFTPIVDERCVGVAELVVVERDAETGVTLGQYGCGWTMLPLFAPSDTFGDVGQGSSKNPPLDEAQMYAGSPRALMFVTGEDWEASLPTPGACALTYNVRNHDKLKAVKRFLQENELVGAMDPVPGFRPVKLHAGGKAAKAAGGKKSIPCIGPIKTKQRPSPQVPRLLEPQAVKLRDAVVVMQGGLEERLRAELERAGGIQLVANSTGTFAVRVAAHNGRAVVSADGWERGALRRKGRARSGGNDVFACKKPLAVRGWARDAMMALVFELEYTVQARIGARSADGSVDAVDADDDVQEVKVIIGSAVFLPFSGRRVRGANADARRSTTKRPLELPLRTDLMRPFSDGMVFAAEGPGVAGCSAPCVALFGAKATVGKKAFGSVKVADVEEEVDSAADTSDGDNEYDEEGGDDDDEDEDEEDEDEDDEEDEEDEEDGAHATRARKRRGKVKTRKRRPAAAADSDTDSEVEDTRYDVPAAGRTGKARKRVGGGLASTFGASRGGLAQGLTVPGVGALRNSILAQSLQAPLRKTGAVGFAGYGPPRGAGSQKAYGPDATTIVSGQANVSNPLSRAARTRLSQHGFTDVLGDSLAAGVRRATGAAAAAIPAPRPTVDLDLEVTDSLLANEFTFQFAAYRVAEGVNVPKPRCVYFTFQFYDCLPTRTERMLLKADGISGSGAPRAVRYAGGLSQPYILVRADKRGHRAPSLALKYVVDSSTTHPDAPRAFAEYLSYKNLYVDVWDGDSLMQIGSIAVEMRGLLRQGERVVKVANEYDVISPNHTASDVNVHAVSLPGGAVVGKVQLLVSNFGMKGQGRDQVWNPSATKEPVLALKDRNWRMAAGQKGGNAIVRHCVRARPLAELNGELAQLLEANHSAQRESRSRSRSEARRRAQKEAIRSSGVDRSSSDAWSLSNKEVAKLLKKFDKYSDATATWNTKPFWLTPTSTARSRPRTMKPAARGRVETARLRVHLRVRRPRHRRR